MTDGIEQPPIESMTPGDWRDYLTANPEYCLVINGRDGVHSIEYDELDETVTFYARGSMGYDFDGTQAVLETITGDSDGLRVQTKEETYE